MTWSPMQVLELLTEPESIARWAPVPFNVLALDGDGSGQEAAPAPAAPA